MKKIFAICWTLLMVCITEADAESKQTIVAANEEEGVYLYATANDKENLYTDFQVKVGGEVVETYGWKASMREERIPEMHVLDLNRDGSREIVVILTLGTGSFLVQKEVHVLQKVEASFGQLTYEEMDVDSPVQTILRDYKITAKENMIRIKGRGELWEVANPCG